MKRCFKQASVWRRRHAKARTQLPQVSRQANINYSGEYLVSVHIYSPGSLPSPQLECVFLQLVHLLIDHGLDKSQLGSPLKKTNNLIHSFSRFRKYIYLYDKLKYSRVSQDQKQKLFC